MASATRVLFACLPACAPAAGPGPLAARELVAQVLTAGVPRDSTISGPRGFHRFPQLRHGPHSTMSVVMLGRPGDHGKWLVVT
jgi:hypothetical protein